jgi:hypothetical protein
MIECDALRLIDEYIKKSSCSTTSATSTRSNSPIQSSPYDLDQFRFSSSSCKNTPNNEELCMLKQAMSHNACMSDDSGVKSNDAPFSPAASSSVSNTPIQSKTMSSDNNNNELRSTPSDDGGVGGAATPLVLDEELTRKNPNRPYSYYAATNFNPLDFAELAKEMESTGNMQPMRSDNKSTSNINTNNNNSDVSNKKKNKRRSLFKTNSSNILSLSLADFKASNASLTKRTKQQPVGLSTNPLPRKNKQSTKAYSYCDRDSKIEINNDENLCDELKTNVKGQNRRSMALRLNKFIRNIFRSTSKNKIIETKKNCNHNVNEKTNSNLVSNRKKTCDDCDEANENDEVFETNQLGAQTQTNNRYSVLTENLRFSRLFGSFRKIGKKLILTVIVRVNLMTWSQGTNFFGFPTQIYLPCNFLALET